MYERENGWGEPGNEAVVQLCYRISTMSIVKTFEGQREVIKINRSLVVGSI